MSLPEPRVRRRGRVNRRERELFLGSLAEGWSVTHAAQRCGVHRGTFYALRAADSEFAAAWEAAYREGSDRIEDEALRRAVEGYEEVTTGADGQLVRVVRRYSDAILIRLLQARKPELYGDAKAARIELSGSVAHEVRHAQGLTLADVVAFAVEHDLVPTTVPAFAPSDLPSADPG